MDLFESLTPIAAYTALAVLIATVLAAITRRRFGATILIAVLAEVLATSIIVILHKQTSLKLPEVVILLLFGPVVGALFGGKRAAERSYPATENGFIAWLKDNHQANVDGDAMQALRDQFYQRYGGKSS